ncbi:MAG: hypothetical protein JST00_22520 [Deltaproteobacteria bacterium]|nr:hypothetical protein [Deltaproteobacteria bacterium]
MRSVCRALLALNVLYCLLALAQDGIPGWRMFESVEDVRHDLTDRDGRVVDVHAFLPRGAHVVDRGELRRIVRFVCEHQRDRAPFAYAERATGLTATLTANGPEGCRIHAPR